MADNGIVTGREHGRKQAVLQVTGMMCAHCVGHVEAALRRLDGVGRASASLETGQVTVEYDPARVSEDDMRRAVEAAGYKAA